MASVVVQNIDRADYAAVEKLREREEKEANTRRRPLAGELGLDIYGMRKRLKAKGSTYL